MFWMFSVTNAQNNTLKFKVMWEKVKNVLQNSRSFLNFSLANPCQSLNMNQSVPIIMWDLSNIIKPSEPYITLWMEEMHHVPADSRLWLTALIRAEMLFHVFQMVKHIQWVLLMYLIACHFTKGIPDISMLSQIKAAFISSAL